jgi:hypothetical protein
VEMGEPGRGGMIFWEAMPQRTPTGHAWGPSGAGALDWVVCACVLLPASSEGEPSVAASPPLPHRMVPSLP